MFVIYVILKSDSVSNLAQDQPTEASKHHGLMERGHLIHIPKNTDPNVHCQNPLYKTKCVLCNTEDDCMVRHYTSVHPESDVFISRPSPAMVERIYLRNGCTMVKEGKINGFCYFCGKSSSISEVEWKQHLLSHTGELEFYCTECRTQLPDKIQHGICSMDKITCVFDDRRSDGTLKMYMCKWCNYTQVTKSRMIRHLEREHHTIASNFMKNVEKVVCIPDLRPLSWEIKSKYKFVPDSTRHRCNEVCGKRFGSYSDFEHHFGQCHNNETEFTCPHCQTVVEKESHRLVTDVSKHIRFHGRHLFECAVCEMPFDCDFNIMIHIIRCHPTENNVFRCIYIKSDDDIEKKECTFWLQCNVCNERYESVAKSVDHFVKAHKSHNIDFKAIKMVKRTTKEGITSCFNPIEKKVLKLLRWLVCKVCDRTLKTKHTLIEHFNRDHPHQEIAVKLGKIYLTDNSWDEGKMENVKFDNHLVFFCATCRDDNTSTSLAYSSVEDVHNHWLVSHTGSTDSKSFQFQAILFVMCAHCKFISSFEEVQRHSKEAHPYEPLAISSVLDQKACALCDYTGNNLGHHMKTRHELILRTDTKNPQRFTEDTLDKLLNVDAHSKFKCDHCGGVFESQDAIQAHSTSQHQMSSSYTKFFDKHNIKLIAGCCEATLDLPDFLDHLADPKHRVDAICSKCNFQTSETFEFVNHQVEAHQMTKDADSLYRRVLQTRFWATKVIFGNGLVVSKHNLLDTEYDDSKPFEMLIETLLANARENLFGRAVESPQFSSPE